ncbi:MAG: protein kinase [Chloroflexi bacterium]|nr:protein kinase [Chloroflexota bacterium]
MPSSRTTGPLPVTIGPYVIAEKLGSGGMATVYRAFRPDGKQVAVKVLAIHLADNENIRKRFEREVVTLRQLKHPHILPLENAGHEEGRPYFVMPLLTGHSLADLIKKGPLPADLISSYTHQIASALDFAHTNKVIHRDIKPSNILIDDQGQTFLADFGVAHLVLGEQDERLTSTGEFIGTVSYAPPEQSRGDIPERSGDLYSLAVMVFEMATGRLPFEGPTSLVVMKKHFHDPVPNPREFNSLLPPKLYDVLIKGMAKLPAARYRSALEFSEALDGALGLHVSEAGQDDDDEAWLHPPEPTTPPIITPDRSASASPAAGGFDPDSEQIDGPDDPFAEFDAYAAPPPAPPHADDFDDHFDAEIEFSDDLTEPAETFAAPAPTAEPIPDPEPEFVAPPLIRPLPKVPRAAPRPSFPWMQFGIYVLIAASVVAIIAAVYLIYRELNPPVLELDAPYRSASLNITFSYPESWSTRAVDLAILSDQPIPTILLSDRPIPPGESLAAARLVIAVQRINSIDVYSVTPTCYDSIPGGPARTFNCMLRNGYVAPDYQDFNTSRYHGGVKLRGSLPVQRASLPVILLPTNGSDWVAVMILYWDNYDGSRDIWERLAKSVRIY